MRAVLLVALMLAGCAPAVVTNSVMNPAFDGLVPSPIVVLFASDDHRIRQSAEAVFAERDGDTFMASYFVAPDLTVATEDLAEQLRASGAEAILYISPSSEIEGGGRAPVTSSQICTMRAADGSCSFWTTVTGGGGRTGVFWSGFTATLIAGSSGQSIWSATVDSRPGRDLKDTSLASLAASAAEQIHRRMVKDGLAPTQ